MKGVDSKSIPEATVARLPIYLRALQGLSESTDSTVSSSRLAELAGVNAAKLRKDLSYFGSYGTRGVGYSIDQLIAEIRRMLGLNHDWRCVIAGMGNLGQALANYAGFADRGFVVTALADSDPAKIGTPVGLLTIEDIELLPSVVTDHDVAMGIITTPPFAAQKVADSMIAGGVTSILNFAPIVIDVPDTVSVRKVDLAVELQILSFYQEQRQPTSAFAP